MHYVQGVASSASNTTITSESGATGILLSNQHLVNNLEVSFDGGTNFYSITPQDRTLDINAIFKQLVVRASSGTVPFIIGVRGARTRPVVSSRIPTTVAEYESIGFPAPDHIWDMQVTDVPFTDLVGSVDLNDMGANSGGLAFRTNTGLPAPQLAATRTTINTSRSQVTGTTFMDVGTVERVAVGMMFRHDTTPANSTEGIVWSKRSANGWRAQYTTTRQVQLFGRPATGGDIAAVVAVDHPLDEWHYGIWIMDRDPGVETGYCHTNKGTASVSLAGKGSFTVATAFGLTSGAAPNQDIAAMATWEGSKVTELIASLPAEFLKAAGV